MLDIGSFPSKAVFMAENKRHNFAYSIQPVYYSSRIFGFMPFTIVYDSKGKIREPIILSFDILWFIVAICLYILAITIQFENMEFFLQTSFVLIAGDYVMLKLSLALSVLVIIMDMYNRHKLMFIFKNIDKFDGKVSNSLFCNQLITG